MLTPDNLEEITRNLRAKDAQCQEILEKSYALSEKYFQILDALCDEDKACVQQYLDLCEDLEDRTLQLVAVYYAANGAVQFVNTDM